MHKKDHYSRFSMAMRRTLFAAVALAGTGTAQAVTLLIGDVDGFGINPVSDCIATGGTCLAYDGSYADSDLDGIIEPSEFLPDWTGNGDVQVNRGDDFDMRSAAELAAINGAQHTDYSITGAGSADGLQFVFEFTVPVSGDDDFGVDHFINFVFGDYDVTPAQIVVDGQTIDLTPQGGLGDGLVQSAYAVVPWSNMTDGQVVIKMIAPREPYLAFDYALLDTDQLADDDNDGVPNSVDNCPTIPNPDQADLDGDGIGDVCDVCVGGDNDGDGVCDTDDNCPLVPNEDQLDSDADGLGDVCDVCVLDPNNDADADGVCGDVDNCPAHPNPDQLDLDGDGLGDACDNCVDVDGDGVCVEDDICPDTTLPDTVPTDKLGINRFADVDGDGVFDTTSPKGKGPGRAYTMSDTGGCSCGQIIELLELGYGHSKFGCSISAMDEWTEQVSDR
jgi:hypothetical protein